MTVTHNFNVDPTRSESAIGEAVSIELKNPAQQNQVSSSELADSSDLATIYVIKQVVDKNKIKALTNDLNLETKKPDFGIGEAVSIELETTALENQPQSSELVDPSPIDLATLLVIQEVLNIVNSERGRVGLSPLRLHSQLTAAAQAHSEDMARHNFMSHTGSDGSSPFDRMRRYGYNFRWAGENVASGYSSPQDVMRGWMNSSGHRANILNPNFRDIGIGYALGNRPYWTQTFGG